MKNMNSRLRHSGRSIASLGGSIHCTGAIKEMVVIEGVHTEDTVQQNKQVWRLGKCWKVVRIAWLQGSQG